jgi:hypothetical protein
MEGRMLAVIVGGENNLVANRLEGWLGEHQVEVMRVDSDWLSANGDPIKNAKYIFVFGAEVSSGEEWAALMNFDFGNEARVVFVEDENRDSLSVVRDSVKQDNDWRAVKLHDVYGPGMGEDGWLPMALRLAVKNQNLVLPPPRQRVRLLYVEDAVEVIMRACLMTGMAGKNFEIYGEEITSTDLAALLMDLAKMTKAQVVQMEMEIKMVDENVVVRDWEELRWKPETGFREGMESTLQYFFGKIDEEARKPKIINKRDPLSVNREPGRQKMWEVEVEEEDENQELSIKNQVLSIEKEEERKIEKEPEVEGEVIRELPKIDNKILEIRNRMLSSRQGAMEDKEDREEIIEESEDRELSVKNQVLSIKDEEEKNPKVRKIKLKLPKIRFGLMVLGILGVAVVAWGMWWGWPIVKTIMLVKKTEKAMVEGETKGLTDSWGKLALMARDRLQTTSSGDYGELMRLMEEGAVVVKEVVEMTETAEKVADGIVLDKEVNWDVEGKKIVAMVEELSLDSGKLMARMAGDWRWLPLGVGNRIGDWQKRLVRERERLMAIRKIVAELPELLGVGGRREYMVLLQNQMELRPTGGFIGSYGILSFDNGKLINFVVNDVYEADGQLKGHVEPPEAIKKYLGEAGYFMRDANWKANFVEASKEIQWFLEKETGRKVDGVIGINLEVAKAILAVTGEIRVTDFGEKINKDNLYEQAEYYSETKFFPGSKQKASFLGGISRQLFEEIKAAKGEKRWKMAEAILLMLNNREIQIAVNNEKTAGVLAEAGWDGGMFNGECATERCLADYLFPVEANLGVNKVNYFIKRQTEMLVEIGTNAVVRTVKIAYENTAKSNAWPGGEYKNYLRVYLPAGINLAGVKINDGSTGEIIKTIGEDEMTVANIGRKTEVGMLVMVPINSKRVVELKYASPINLLSGDKFSYLNYLQKQSGWGDTGLVTLVTIPEDWQPVQVEPEATVVGGKLLFNRRWERDIKLGVEISK